MAERREPTLAEMIDAGLFLGPDAGMGPSIPQRIRSARRFILDDEAVAVVSELRRHYFSVPILEWAKSPFDGSYVWVEYDHKARLRGTNTPLSDDQSDRSGFLISTPEDGIVEAVCIWSMKGKAFSSGFAMGYSVDGRDIQHPEDRDNPNAGAVTAQLLGFLDPDNPQAVPEPVRRLAKHVNIRCVDGLFEGKEGLVRLGLMLQESTGDLGFLTSALALINHGLVRFADRPRPKGQRVLNRRLRPYLSDSVVSVCIPGKLSPIDALKQAHRAEQARKRAHEVRGHFRHYRDGRVVWIKSHQRGDASLGFVRQRYEVRAAE